MSAIRERTATDPWKAAHESTGFYSPPVRTAPSFSQLGHNFEFADHALKALADLHPVAGRRRRARRRDERITLVSTAAELGGGVLLAVGLLTPLATAALIAQSVVIVGLVHLPKGRPAIV